MDNQSDTYPRNSHNTPDDFEFIPEEEARQIERRRLRLQRGAEKRQQGEPDHESDSGIFEDGRGADKRLLQKRRKRRYGELKRIASSLNIKTELQALSHLCKYNCWGPDTAGDKERLTLGIFLNYIDENSMAHADPPQRVDPRLFGVWFYFSDQDKGAVRIIVGDKETDGDDDTPRPESRPPDESACLLAIDYTADAHDNIQAQIGSVLRRWGAITPQS